MGTSEVAEVDKFRRNLKRYSAQDLRHYLRGMREVEENPLYNPHLTATEQIGWIMVRLGEMEESSRPAEKGYRQAVDKFFGPPRRTTY